MKKLILVTSPPACGKTFISKQLAKTLKHIVYLDKDTLIPLSKQVFIAANQEINRSSDFFETYVRNVEYTVVIDLALEALEYEDLVLINAPFTREIHDLQYMQNFKKQVNDNGAELVVVWVDTDVEVCHQRMIDRASDRDTWKLEHWDEYIATRDYNLPEVLQQEGSTDHLLIFHNSSDEEFAESMKAMEEELLK
ncbi:AAA family ATPase [Anaerosporobacter faecicola]|uniref:AAA family ATPase n=1 Tax=Anaerosporobacter faecicola TaxID=2718714 RepID=UPI00143BBFCD|nr:AAA family ATPase [Anaerosporobacter faecicola]